MRTIHASLSTLALVLSLAVPGAADTGGGIGNSMWQTEGKVAAKYVVKGGGALKGAGVFSQAPCDIWTGDDGGQAFVGLAPTLFPALPEEENEFMGTLVVDPVLVRGATAKVANAKPETTAVLGMLAGDLYTFLSGRKASVNWPKALRVGKLDVAKLGALVIDPATIQASGKFKAVKKGAEMKGAVTVKFAGTMADGALAGKAVKGKIVVKVKGVASAPPL